jgi:glycosyltransferase involved in cell wall biosynthesis
VRGRNRLLNGLALGLSCVKLFAILLGRRPRIVHFFLPMAYLLGAPLAILARVPIRIMSRRSLNNYQDNHPTLRRLELRLHRQMGALLGNSKAVYRQLIEEGSPLQRTVLIYNGAALPDPAPEKLGRQADQPLALIIVANLIPYKGHEDLLRALAGAQSQMPSSWILRCVGRDDGIGGYLTKLAQDLGLSGRVTLIGERRDVGALLAVSDIAILCSHEEGFSNAILEAMAAGLPVIATDVGGNRESVADGETGLIVPAKDPAALSTAILALASDAALRRRFGAAGRQRARSLFTLEGCVAQYDALYRALDRGEIPLVSNQPEN